jgi:hypothetical protein
MRLPPDLSNIEVLIVCPSAPTRRRVLRGGRHAARRLILFSQRHLCRSRQYMRRWMDAMVKCQSKARVSRVLAARLVVVYLWSIALG